MTRARRVWWKLTPFLDRWRKPTQPMSAEQFLEWLRDQ